MTDELLKGYLGKKIFVRTVTYHYTGLMTRFDDGYLLLEKAAWIAESDRWMQALAAGLLVEVEPYPGDCLISRAAIVDLSEWSHELPRTQLPVK
jgi:hypothetical protein